MAASPVAAGARALLARDGRTASHRRAAAIPAQSGPCYASDSRFTKGCVPVSEVFVSGTPGRGVGLGRAMRRLAAVGIGLLIILAAAAAPAGANTTHRFPGLKFTFEAPPGWLVYTVAGQRVPDPRTNFHTEVALMDLKYGDYMPVIEFTRPAPGAAMAPSISIFATRRGEGDTFDRARWALDNVMSQKKANTLAFEVVMAPRKFTTGKIDFLFADLIYGVNMPDGKQYGLYDQTFVIDAKTMLLIVDVKTATDDTESRRQAVDLMKWFRFD
jgi:hypothetical protein